MMSTIVRMRTTKRSEFDNIIVEAKIRWYGGLVLRVFRNSPIRNLRFSVIACRGSWLFSQSIWDGPQRFKEIFPFLSTGICCGTVDFFGADCEQIPSHFHYGNTSIYLQIRLAQCSVLLFSGDFSDLFIGIYKGFPKENCHVSAHGLVVVGHNAQICPCPILHTLSRRDNDRVGLAYYWFVGYRGYIHTIWIVLAGKSWAIEVSWGLENGLNIFYNFWFRGQIHPIRDSVSGRVLF